MNRRHFLQSTGMGALSLASFPYRLFAGETKKHATDKVMLGPRKIAVSRLAMGTGTVGSGGSSNQTRKLGYTGLAELLRAAYDDLDRFRRELSTDYIDVLLLHCMTDGDWNRTMQGPMEVISEAREKGIVRSHGTSCHTLAALKTAAAEPWVEVDLARINPAQLHMDSDPRTVLSVLRQMKQAGKGVIGMKILGQGGLRHKVDESLQFALAHQPDYFDGFTIGSESRAEMEDLLRRIPAASTRA
jgi:hypothetical protein